MVSIIMPVRNAAGLLETAVGAISCQTYARRELLVIDGGSHDGTRETLVRLDDWIDYWESGPDQGIYDAMNRGIDAARGEWVYFMGVDDAFCDDQTLAGLMADAAASRNADLILGRVITPNGRLSSSRFNAALLLKNTVHHQSAVYRRRVFDRFRYGCRPTGSDRCWQISGDYQLNLRLFMQGCRAHAVDRTIAHCGAGASQEGRWVGYWEEILIRHHEMPFWTAFPFDLQTVMRYKAKWIRLQLDPTRNRNKANRS